MYSIEYLRQLLASSYELTGEIERLAGEADFNFLISSNHSNCYLLKISPADTAINEIDLQLDIIRHLSERSLPLNIPKAIPDKNGHEYSVLDDGSIIRLQTWVCGRMMADVNPRTPALLSSWGKSMGCISNHLKDYDHSAAHRFYKWNPAETLYSKKYAEYIIDKEQQALASYFWSLFETEALPYLPTLRKSVNHNDGHELNIIVDNNLSAPSVTGIIDFGDTLYCETINELAIACAYACMDVPDPLRAASQLISGYNNEFKLEEKELRVLFPLICARLMITVANAAYNKHHDPDKKYLIISERPAWDLLQKLKSISPNLAHYTFRHACELDPVPYRKRYDKWVDHMKSEFHPIIAMKDKRLTQLDLSVGSTDLGHNDNFLEIRKFQKRIADFLEDNNADYGIGGYLETRPFYTSDAFQTEGNEGAQWRTTHLGLDIWTEENCPVFAPWSGTVFSIHDNEGDCDYGPTLILEHCISDTLTFYTLYGHLARTSLQLLQKGETINKGQLIAHVGGPPENGNWPSHLHFQVITDMLGNQHDFPGVAYPHEIIVWSNICPDPRAWFDFEFVNHEIPNAQCIIQSRKENLGQSLSLSYDEPLHMVRGHMQYLYDTSGRRYLDTANNVPHVGHQHSRIVNAATRQLELLNTNTRYLHANLTNYAEAILKTLPKELSVIHFVNSGSEANELALRMAKAYSGQENVLAIESGYHGNTAACIAVSSYKFDGNGGQGCPPGTHLLPIPDVYRGSFKHPHTAGQDYAAFANELILNIKSKGEGIAGFIGESILSCGGQIVLPKGYLKSLYNIVRSAGGLCIADEVQVGFGRPGNQFWGFQLQEVVPDIVTMGKPIGNGHPLGAVVCTQEVAEAFANGMEYFNTFGGNPVSCAIGQEVLSIVQDEALQSHALAIGSYLQENLRKLQSKHPIIGDVRGHGLFLGFELVLNRIILEPADQECSYLANRMKQRGILISTDGPLHNVIKIKPPMCFNKANVDYLIQNLDLVLNEDFMKDRIKNIKH